MTSDSYCKKCMGVGRRIIHEYERSYFVDMACLACGATGPCAYDDKTAAQIRDHVKVGPVDLAAIESLKGMRPIRQ
jgi:hypothetical protein